MPHKSCVECEDDLHLHIIYLDDWNQIPQWKCTSPKRMLNCLVSDLGDEDSCIACETGFFFDSDSMKCDKCTTEFSHCAECESDNCFSCKEGYTLNEAGQCEMPCQHSEPFCGECSETDSSMCVKCAGNLKQIDDECGCDSLSFVDITEEPNCRTCSSEIENCISCSIDGQSCLDCKHGNYLTSNGKCSSDPCEIRSENGECTSCVDKSMYTQDGICVKKCSQPFTLIDGACDCLLGQSLIDGKCSKCSTQNCDKCSSDGSC
jgi:hypothetical protein